MFSFLYFWFMQTFDTFFKNFELQQFVRKGVARQLSATRTGPSATRRRLPGSTEATSRRPAALNSQMTPNGSHMLCRQTEMEGGILLNK